MSSAVKDPPPYIIPGQYQIFILDPKQFLFFLYLVGNSGLYRMLDIVTLP